MRRIITTAISARLLRESGRHAKALRRQPKAPPPAGRLRSISSLSDKNLAYLEQRLANTKAKPSEHIGVVRSRPSGPAPHRRSGPGRRKGGTAHTHPRRHPQSTPATPSPQKIPPGNWPYTQKLGKKRPKTPQHAPTRNQPKSPRATPPSLTSKSALAQTRPNTEKHAKT